MLFKTKMNELVKIFVPTIRIRTDSTNPWLTKTLLSLRNRKKRPFAKAKRVDTTEVWEAYNSCLREYTRSLKLSKINSSSMTYRQSCGLTQGSSGT